MTRPCILLLIPSMAGVGGTERMVHSMSGLLRSAGCDVHQASFDAPGDARHFSDDGPFHALGPIPRLPLPLRPLAYGMAAWRLRSLKRRLKVAATISNLWGADLINVLSGGPGRRVALCHINVVGNPANRLMVRLRPFVAAVYRRFDKVIAVSETLAEEVRGLYALHPARVGHVDNFTDAIETSPQWGTGDAPARFVWCGRFAPEKNVEGLLAAWSHFAARGPQAQLVLVGDGPERERLESLAAELGLNAGGLACLATAQVVFAGRQADPAAFIAGARCLVLSSRAEGLPMVVLEALALGIPVLGADCPSGGVRTALAGEGHCDPLREDAELAPAGVLLPIPERHRPRTLEAWVDALHKASTDAACLRGWQAGARARARHFNSDVARERWTAVLAELGVEA